MKLHKLYILAACAGLSIPASAELRLNGFATMAVGQTTSDDEFYLEYDDSLNFEVDSILGLQASADLGDGLEAVVQLKATGAEDWDTGFEWAYISYKFNDTFKLIFGRQRIPYYVFSDFYDVGYAYPWIAPPANAYSTPFESIDGISLHINNQIGSWESSFQVLFGRDSSTLFAYGYEEDFEVKDGYSLGWNMVRDWLTIRAGYTYNVTSLSVTDVETLTNAWAATSQPVADLSTFDPVFGEIANEMQAISGRLMDLHIDEADASFTDIGFVADIDPLYFAGEWTRLDMKDTFVGQTDAWYLTAGYRFIPSVMLHLTYGEREGEPPESITEGFPVNITGGLSAELDAGVNGLLFGTEALLAASEIDSELTIIGVRWDFHPSAAAKFEYTINKDNLVSANDANLIRFAISTVF